MNRKLLPALLLLACLPGLGACGQEEPARDAGVFAEVSTELQKEMRQASEEVRDALATENIDISDHDDGTTAEVTPQGDLLIDGSKVEIDAAQRALLLEYRSHIAYMAGTGAAIGMQGASLATDAVGKAFASIFSGDTEQMEREIEAEAEKLAQQALKLCERLPAMLRTQQQLAAALPEFRPYADMTQDDIDDCHADVDLR